ncbi:MAG: sulfatase-like hydrolase/transferase [Chitinophagaceae bacterium]|nr:sulfatase-like hydrolase/transferase [Chitinophagaceae bacterium]
MFLLNRLIKSNYHFLWVIVFFILHGCNEFGSSISLKTVVTFFIILSISGWLLFIGYNFVSSNKLKAGLFATVLLGVYLFFGAVQDFISSFRSAAKFGTTPYLLSIIFCLLICFFLVLRTKKNIPSKFIKYLNLLFLLLNLLEVGQIVTSRTFSSSNRSDLGNDLRICDSCKKPPVYLVILDEYSGKHTLQFFQFNNSPFYQELSQRGFHVVENSFANYPRTLLSMASMFNMEYIGAKKELLKTEHYTFRKAIKQIEKNPVTDFFKKQGYEIRNYSFFDLKDAPAMVQNDLWGGNIRFYLNQTLYGRIQKSLPKFLARKKISNFFIERVENDFLNGIDKSLAESVERERQNSILSKPTFTYIHLNMPHAPYLKDSLGNRIPEKVRQAYNVEEKQSAYLQYLVYCNKRILKWIDEILIASEGRAVILLMSDHGTALSGVHTDRGLDNLNAIYIPGADYSKWYKGFSNVNQFRLLFNELFKQNMELKPDITP